MLSSRDLTLIDTHLATAGQTDGARVEQADGLMTVYHADTGRMWAYHAHQITRSKQECLYHASFSASTNAITCGHPVKFWDLRRRATARETARLQGFPEAFKVPRVRFVRLLGNALVVPCAAASIARIVGPDERIRHLDVCAGVGGFSWAARSVTPHVECVGFCEINKPAVECYLDNFPSSVDLGDATALDVVPTCDLVTAGFPCQPFSRASTDAQRTAHPHRAFYKTVLDLVRRSECTRVVLENVPFLLTIGRAEFEDLTRGLEEMGFAWTCDVLVGTEFGVPQKRRRVYIVARRDGEIAPLTKPSVESTCLSDIIER